MDNEILGNLANQGLWAILGAAILGAAIAYAMIRNRGRNRADDARTEAATRDLYKSYDAADADPAQAPDVLKR